MHPLRKAARIAGFLYLLVVISGFFTLMVVPGKLFVPGSATATVNNVLAHQPLFRAYIVVEIFSELFFIATVLALYQLLKGVGSQLATLMALLVLIGAPLAFVGIGNEVAVLTFARGANFLAVFDPPQRDALAVLLIHVNAQATLVSEMFWGLWLFPLGVLVYRSGFLPRLLGIWLIINGLAYVTISTTGLLIPDHLQMISMIATPILLGEVAFMLWLLIVGARVPPSPAAVA